MQRNFHFLFNICIILSRFFTVENNCLNNRQIFTEKTGTIKHGVGRYANNLYCEWLIQGEPHETISVHLKSAETECSFDFLHFHDGNSTLNSPLIASLSGSPHNNIHLFSSGSEVYIVLNTDANTNNYGFTLSYTINKCPRNCSNNATHTNGKCRSDGLCDCIGERTGQSCQYDWCPNLCGQANNNGKCNMTEKECMCNSGFYGEDCGINKEPSIDKNKWFQIAPYSSFLKKRSEHISEFISSLNMLFVFGGHNLNIVFDDVVTFNFTSNKWKNVQKQGIWPTGVYFSASCTCPSNDNGFFMFGGEFSNKSLSNNLWFFNASSSSWKLLSKDSSIPGHAGHSMVCWNSRIYVVGGRIDQGDAFSTFIYQYNILTQQWSAKKPHGKTQRMFGHSVALYNKTQSIVVYGGYQPFSIWSAPLKTNRILTYHIQNNIWSVISNQSGDFIAYHRSVIAGNYLIAYGGFSKCGVAHSIQYFNLECNQWVSESTLLDNPATNPFIHGTIFSHSVALKDHQTLIVTGGFNNVEPLSTVLAFKLPSFVVENGTSQHCAKYNNKDRCNTDPSCHYCDGTRKCDSSLYPVGCPAHHCSTKCSVFASCESCSSQLVCQWCPLTGQCQIAEQICRSPLVFWGGVTQPISNPSGCGFKDTQPGITEMIYFEPKNELYPDHVKIRREIRFEKKDFGDDKIELAGRVFPFLESDLDAEAELLFVYSELKFDLSLSVNERSNTMSEVYSVETLGDRKDYTKTRVDGSTKIFPLQGPKTQEKDQVWYNIKMNVQKSPDRKSSRLQLFSDVSHDYKTMDYQTLAPFTTDGQCGQYVSCTGCISDSSCGWCGGNCTKRTPNSSCVDATGHWRYMSHKQEQCMMCSDHFTCTECNKDPFCGWDDVTCKRKELASPTRAIECHAGCGSFSTLDSCINKKGCFWCKGRSKCLAFVDFLPQNHFSECYHFATINTRKQFNCTELSNCSACLAEVSCGWCFNEADPRNGSCTVGNFGGPMTTCAVTDHTGWKYDRCPDVNECTLAIDTCKNNSHCVNTDGSYLCQCDQGFEGDGKFECTKTCWPPCGEHGACNLTAYQCVCNLGWMGAVCSVDCGCNGHSACDLSGVGTCDNCQHYTHGNHCEFCVDGSHGNATTEVGCTPCKCNGHGDPSKNLCDKQTGRCFCVNNTKGYNCENCLDGFQYDTISNRCLLGCQHSNIHSAVQSGIILARDKDVTHACHWTIIAQNLTNDQLIFPAETPSDNDQQILLRVKHLRTSCFDSYLQIYDGVPPNPRSTTVIAQSPFSLLATLCGPDVHEERRFFRATTGIFTIVYEGNIIKNADEKVFIDKERGFEAEYTALHCPRSCPPPFVCGGVSGNKCACPENRTGVLCQYEKCPNSCHVHLGRGVCNQQTNLCECRPGFTGVDCANATSALTGGVKFAFSLLSIHQENVHSYFFKMYGSTMESYNEKLYIFGNGELMDSQGYFLMFDLMTNTWASPFPTPNDVLPNNRVFHCSFVFQDAMYLYGGLEKGDVSQELWAYNFTTSLWKEIQLKRSRLDGRLAGHTCTVIGAHVYIIGGYTPADGLSEFVYFIDMTTLRFNTAKFDPSGLESVGVYFHVALYDNNTNYIYIHGGMSYHDDDIKPSNRTYALRPGDTPVWNYVESHPDDKHITPRLLGHTAMMDRKNGDIFIAGGYSDLHGFNFDTYVWKTKCNRWIKFQHKGGIPTVFASSTSREPSGSTFYVFAGYDPTKSDKNVERLVSFTIPLDLCSFSSNADSCLSNHGCQWCGGHSSNNSSSMNSSSSHSNNSITHDNNNTGICIKSDSTIHCNGTIQRSASECSVNEAETRNCDTFTSCSTCMSGYGDNSQRCHWCKCKTHMFCLSKNKRCTCSSTVISNDNNINKCHKGQCYTSTCRNCPNECFWTSSFQYVSETQRRYAYDSSFSYNCFTRSLIRQVKQTAGYDYVLADSEKTKCPSPCDSFEQCDQCVASKGDFSGTSGCVWSAKLSQCVSVATLPLYCSNARCGVIDHEKGTCPVEGGCSKQKKCSTCLRMPNCGWCAKGGEGFGQCIDGDFLEPYKGVCGSRLRSNGLTVEHANSANYTWAFAQCPLENECANGHHNCTDHEICGDRVIGFTCLCKSGYERINGTCYPVCKPSCNNGICVEPDQCRCDFGWTGVYCNVSCQCNGHSDCQDEFNRGVCLDCKDSTQGKTCEQCKPLYFGNPRDSRSCQSCTEFCNENSGVCITNDEEKTLRGMPDIYSNKTAVLLWINENVTKGPQFESETKCMFCENLSSGIRCQDCVTGYYRDKTSGNCRQCNCNGHGDTCDKDGLGCKCSHNTRTSICKRDCQNEQCSKCISNNFIGDPKDGHQCYKNIDTDLVETVLLPQDSLSFFAVSPTFTNVRIRINIDVLVGSIEIFIADENQIFRVDMNGTRQQLHVHKDYVNTNNDDSSRLKRDVASSSASGTNFLPSRSAYKNKITTFEHYESGILWIYNVERRVVIQIDHSQHNLSKKKFYFVLRPTNKTGGQHLTKFNVYFRQDLPRIDLLLFFLVLTVILLFILSGFIIGMKLRVDFVRNTRNQRQQIELNVMQSRPLAAYPLLFAARKTEGASNDNNPVSGGRGGNNKKKNLHKTNDQSSINASSSNVISATASRLILPLSVQETDDKLAAVVSTVVQLPSNEASEWNFIIGTGLCLVQNQHLIQVRTSTSNAPSGGRRLQTRIHSTQINS